MPDPIDTNLSPSSTPTPEPVTPPATPAPASDLPNPQDAVNAALSTPTPVVEPSTPTPSPATPLTANSMPPLEPLSPAPTVEAVTPMTPPAVEASGDDVPLSLVTPSSTQAMPAPTSTASVTEPVAPTTPATSPTATPPAEEPVVAPLSASPLPPAPTEGFKPLPEKKKKSSKIILGILGFFVMIGLVGFGYYYFTGGVVPQVACVGYKECQEWKKNRDIQDQINANSKQAQYGGYAGGGVGPNSNLAKGNSEGLAQYAKLTGNENLLKSDASAADKAALAKLNEEYQKTLTTTTNSQGQVDAGAAAAKILATAATEKVKAEAAAGGVPLDNPNHAGMYLGEGDQQWHYIDAPGVIEAGLARAVAGGASSSDRQALKGYYQMTDANIEEALERIASGQTWVPPGVGCTGTPTTDPTCNQWHWTTCSSGNGKNGIGCSFATLEGDGNPGDNPSPSPSDSSSLVCSGITRTPTTAPVVGSVLTFTCAGTVTPTSALSYDFRYSINDASPSALANKTATTAELTINACGTYKVQCRACATIAGVKQCSPVWTGATQ